MCPLKKADCVRSKALTLLKQLDVTMSIYMAKIQIYWCDAEFL